MGNPERDTARECKHQSYYVAKNDWRVCLKCGHAGPAPIDEDREAKGWEEAALYTEEAEAQDDFMTGWRTAHRVREAEQQRDDVEYAALCEQVEQLTSVIQSAYNALHMETRTRAVEILHAALAGRREIVEPEWEYGRLIGEAPYQWLLGGSDHPSATHRRTKFVPSGPWLPIARDAQR